ncbi:MAG: lysine--tRNA ligase, partial [Candidatus Aenigmatarchaeota archaeon]
MGKENPIFWADRTAQELIERENSFKRGVKVFRCESGLGASGIPHIGSVGDVLRQYAVALALKDSGVKSELICYSDDRDGLRKVPSKFPDSLEKFIGAPVTSIPDPFKCHASYGEHMSSILVDAVEKLGLEYKFQSATDAYRKGILDAQIEKILGNVDDAGRIIQEMVGQEKFLQIYPYYPVCEKCGKIYTTRVVETLQKEHKVRYVCDQEFVGKNQNSGQKIVVKGCGHEGETSYFKSDGKLAWKVEFAARWDALKIVFEAVGKDILDSVKINDRISKEVLGFAPPLHMVYELFLEKGGEKISKSFGNVFTAQDWLRYGSPQSLNLLMFKRSAGARELSENDIPVYMDEVDSLERIYSGEKKIANEKEFAHLKRLFEYVYFLKQPKTPRFKINYNVLANITRVIPIEDKFKVIENMLEKSGHIDKLSKEDKNILKERIAYASNWIEVMGKDIRPQKIDISNEERQALEKLLEALKEKLGAEEMQTLVFTTAKKFGIDAARFFI